MNLEFTKQNNSALVKTAVELNGATQQSQKFFRERPEQYINAIMGLTLVRMAAGETLPGFAALAAAVMAYTGPEIMIQLNEEIERRLSDGEMSIDEKQQAEQEARAIMEQMDKLMEMRKRYENKE